METMCVYVYIPCTMNQSKQPSHISESLQCPAVCSDNSAFESEEFHRTALACMCLELSVCVCAVYNITQTWIIISEYCI